MNLFSGQGQSFFSTIYDNVCARISGNLTESDGSDVSNRDNIDTLPRTTQSAKLRTREMSSVSGTAKTKRKIVDDLLEGTFDDEIVVRLPLALSSQEAPLLMNCQISDDDDEATEVPQPQAKEGTVLGISNRRVSTRKSLYVLIFDTTLEHKRRNTLTSQSQNTSQQA